MSYKKWTDYEIQYLKRNYGIEGIKEIAYKLHRTSDSIFKKAKRLGLTTAIKKWNEKEINYLTEKWGTSSMELIAKTLSRSPVSIRKKAIELQLGPSRIGNGEFLTTGDIGFLLNKDPNLIYRWARAGYIKGRRFGEKKIFQITPKDFVLFLKQYPQKWDAIQARTDLIKGYIHASFRLPEWFENKINYDKTTFMNRRIVSNGN
ncbi:hypothetical protein SAMN05446037_100798 [Anaerovirgula multivorans]|uniref:Helix-turn-helix domain-containing protein n=1 Tax=Anaerovirgula multivorans TaxID=312168 RepID=A0A239DBV0_9FIRM|nr:hypothetical protein [Anaerovirgula multivorans]SNS29800.1 hypothetical protein SAMN05446037_100798 [Anaerovirgula multivorans]